MATLITNGVKISVEPFYLPSESKPGLYKHVFSYRVTIENVSNQTVQLLRRHWYIIESTGLVREVEGKGVIGQQPVLKPGESHQYESWSPLRSSMGKMYGTYLMSAPHENRMFYVRIPDFYLIADYVNN